jgi:hypothetical protein
MYYLRNNLIFITVTIISNVLFLSQSRDIVPKVFAMVANQPNNTSVTIPPVKLVYANHTYDILPFVVVDEDGLRKLNFPRLADEYRLDGIFSVEVRALYDEGKYVTYTRLVKIHNPAEVQSGGLNQPSPTSNQSALPNIFS